MVRTTDSIMSTSSNDVGQKEGSPSPPSYASHEDDAHMLSILSMPAVASRTPKKRNKLHAMWLRHQDTRAAKKRGTDQEQRVQTLLDAARSLHDEIQQRITAARALLERAQATPRPATPPEREPLFQRPEDAPLSDYERHCLNYNDSVEHYDMLKRCFGQL